MSRAGLKHIWLTYRRDQLWFPLAFLALFVFVTLVLPRPAVRFNVARAYLGFIVPLIGGITAAYAVLDDPALELRFSTPVRAGQTLLSRVGLILSIQAVCAVGFQLFDLALGVDVSPLGGLLGVQLAWLSPTLALIALGAFGALAGAQTVVGAFLAGACWLVQLTMKSWFEVNGRSLYLFLGVFGAGPADLVANRLVLLGLSVSLLFFSWLLLHRQERFL